jgi:hypothetical protein
LCMYCMRQSVWPKPGLGNAARLTSAASSWGAASPVAHVELRYINVATSPMRRGRPANALRFTNQPSDHGDHGCQEACARRPTQAARTFKYGIRMPHKYWCDMHMPHCHGRLLLLCATRAQATVPALGRAGHGHVLVIGSCCAPARLGMHWQSSIQSTVRASGVQPRLLARPGSDLASDPCLSVRMPRGVITQWDPGSSRPCRPCTVCLWGSGSLFTSSLYLCLVATLHNSVVRSWRPTCLARECKICPEELFGSYKRVGVHHTQMVAKCALCA